MRTLKTPATDFATCLLHSADLVIGRYDVSKCQLLGIGTARRAPVMH